jgi:hypothetical protein
MHHAAATGEVGTLGTVDIAAATDFSDFVSDTEWVTTDKLYEYWTEGTVDGKEATDEQKADLDPWLGVIENNAEEDKDAVADA